MPSPKMVSRFILHLQLEPLQISPPIWRRLQISDDCTLRDLHHFIQAAMGWADSHLHEFRLGEQLFLPEQAWLSGETCQDDRKIRLKSLLHPGDRLRYLYDFGDSWQHVLAVEQQLPNPWGSRWCQVLDGQRACPPEDIGGVSGYLALLASPDFATDLLPQRNTQPFDPERFDCYSANNAVLRICHNRWR